MFSSNTDISLKKRQTLTGELIAKEIVQISTGGVPPNLQIRYSPHNVWLFSLQIITGLLSAHQKLDVFLIRASVSIPVEARWETSSWRARQGLLDERRLIGNDEMRGTYWIQVDQTSYLIHQVDFAWLALELIQLPTWTVS